jgi:hypothetical protein
MGSTSHVACFSAGSISVHFVRIVRAPSAATWLMPSTMISAQQSGQHIAQANLLLKLRDLTLPPASSSGWI